ncbi:MAG: TolC family protein [Planctomycetaceae bacterium]|nr:TolC family protein [Planctomycetaceae bacterium]
MSALSRELIEAAEPGAPPVAVLSTDIRPGIVDVTRLPEVLVARREQRELGPVAPPTAPPAPVKESPAIVRVSNDPNALPARRAPALVASLQATIREETAAPPSNAILPPEAVPRPMAVPNGTALPTDSVTTPLAPPPSGLAHGWWQQKACQPLRPKSQSWPVDLDLLMITALQFSAHVQAINLEPQIVETEIARQSAEFDTRSFVESKWNSINDPVGNTLTTGGPTRLKDQNLENSGGLQRRTLVGGQARIAQEIGLRNTNSVFFLPKDQANTRFIISYTQPLLRGRGVCYNESLVVLAQTDTRLARNELQTQLQQHLFDVANTYWQLCLERSRFLQQQEGLAQTEMILRELEARREIDLLQSQVMRARGAVAVRRAAVQRAELTIRNRETQLWALTSAPQVQLNHELELIPLVLPSCDLVPIDPQASVREALQNRPEISSTFERIRSAETRLSVAKHELLPVLNAAFEVYTRGLQGQQDVWQSFLNQFSRGNPSYTAGLTYSMPLGNNAAQASLRRRDLELRQLLLELDASLKRISAEVENAVRDVLAAHAELAGHHEAMIAARAEVDYLLQRWRLLPGEDRYASMLLDDVLNALDRLISAEGTFAQSQVNYAIALTEYKRAAGLLVNLAPVEPVPPTPELTPEPPVPQPVPPPPVSAQPVEVLGDRRGGLRR